MAGLRQPMGGILWVFCNAGIDAIVNIIEADFYCRMG